MSSDPSQDKKFDAKRYALRMWHLLVSSLKNIKSGNFKNWIAPGIALTLSIILLWNLGGKVREEVWAYYTDGEDINISAEENKARYVLWEPPSPTILPQGENTKNIKKGPSGNFEAAFSSDGRKMAIVLEQENGADIFVSNWDGLAWSSPEPLSKINTKFNERGPSFSLSGNRLFFSSDRDGGLGGYDIYVTTFDGEKWGSPQSLGSTLNSSANETGPAPSMDESGLYFSSDREGKSDQDIFYAKLDNEDTKEALSFLQPIAVDDLNSRADDIQAALTRRGSLVFMSSDRQSDSRYGVYMSRIIDGQIRDPERVDLYLNNDNVTDPAVRMDGFDLLFSTDYGASDSESLDYRLYRSTTREVFGYYDSSRWEEFKLALGKLKWWLIAALAALLALIYLLETWQDITSLLHKCIAASIAAHLLLLLLATAWFITQEFEPDPESELSEIEISLDALAQEELAMESAPEEAQISDPTEQITIEKTETSFDIPELQAQDLVENVVDTNIDFQDSMEIEVEASQTQIEENTETPKLEQSSLIAELSEPTLPEIDDFALEEDPNPNTNEPEETEQEVFEPSFESTEITKAEISEVSDSAVESESESEAVESGSLVAEATEAESQLTESGSSNNELSPTSELATGALPELAMLEPGAPQLEELEGEPGAQPADTSEDTFEPSGGVAKLETEQEASGAASDSAVESESESEAVESGSLVAEATEAESQLTESGSSNNELSPTSELATGALPVYAISAPLLPDALEDNQTDLKKGGLTELIKKHRGKPSLEVIKQLGGSDATEKAIIAAIEWLSKVQEKDGRWDTRKFQAETDYDVGGTALALLCYYGWGARHDRPGKYQNNVKKALEWLLAQQREDGNLARRGMMYSHAIAAIALCEAYGITKDDNIKSSALAAIEYTISSQHQERGGWRYSPGQDSDTSVTGWQLMALHSARMAGLELPEKPFDLARRWLDFAGGGEHGGLYGYQSPSDISRAMVATGMFCRQLDMVPPSSPKMIESAELMKRYPIRDNNPDLYYIYYGTLALYQHQGPIWQQWNNDLKRILPDIQIKSGSLAGSWDLSRSNTKGGGRIASTTLAILSLEVYYRILPMYGFRGDEPPEAKIKLEDTRQ
ncbi:MAG: prenyltransferase/squalene oxidase repeat-containing protein [Verrucomicrobiota bacterium]|nr:prenyltransferase/squalene oxidase repeat-containing protein [Verrucomicrobiota bacterium]